MENDGLVAADAMGPFTSPSDRYSSNKLRSRPTEQPYRVKLMEQLNYLGRLSEFLETRYFAAPRQVMHV
jgi:hypothetical protein